MKIGYLMQQGVEIRRPPFDGPANHVREVIAELQNLGHAVRLLARWQGQIWQSDDLTHFELAAPTAMDRGLRRLFERAVRRVQTELRLPYAGLFESWRFALAGCQALGEVDMLYERLSWMGYGGGLAARWLNKPLVLEYNGDPLHDLDSQGIAPQGLQRRLSLALMTRAVGQAARVVASGDGWREQFVERWRFDRSRVVTIENGTGLVKRLAREQLRAFQDPPRSDSTLTLVYLGGFYPWHGVQVLLRALRHALDQGAPLRLLCIGAGVGLEAAKQQVADAQLEAQVTFTGQLSPEDFAPHLAGADIGLSPYCGWKEYSGLKLFDYKAAGLAIIASGEHGQPATLKHGYTGWIVPPCDEEALSAAMLQLAADPELRRGLGRAARLEAEQCHGWDQTARQLDQLFQSVIAHAA